MVDIAAERFVIQAIAGRQFAVDSDPADGQNVMPDGPEYVRYLRSV